MSIKENTCCVSCSNEIHECVCVSVYCHTYAHRVVFIILLPSRAIFCTTFLKNRGRGESLRTTICLNTVVGVSKGMLPVEYFYSTKASFSVG